MKAVTPLLPSRTEIVRANGIDHRVLFWDHANAKATLVLCHGYLDNAWSFAFLARELALLGYACIAFDFRGHGESSRVAAGGYYHFPDYVLDMHELFGALELSDIHLVGHSMGGTACALFASLQTTNLRSLTLLEGLGPEAVDSKTGAERLALWIASVRKTQTRVRTPIRSIEVAAERMRMTHSELDTETARFVAERSTRACAGGFEFAFDPLHQTTSPIAFRADVFCAALAKISAPVLAVTGSRGFRTSDHAQRLMAFTNVRDVTLEDASHMMHWFRAKDVAQLVASHVQLARE